MRRLVRWWSSQATVCGAPQPKEGTFDPFSGEIGFWRNRPRYPAAESLPSDTEARNPLVSVVFCPRRRRGDLQVNGFRIRGGSSGRWGRLEALIDEIGFGAGPEDTVVHLESIVEDVTRAIEGIRSGQREAEHHEKEDLP